MRSTSARFTALAVGALVVAAGTVSFALADTGPLLTLATTASSTTNLASVPVSATFSESVEGFATSSIHITNGSLSDFTGSGADYSFTVAAASQGLVSITVDPGAATSSASSTPSQGASFSYTYDSIAPTLSAVVPIASSTMTATSSFMFNADKAGSITFGGSCTSATSLAVRGDTTLTINADPDGDYDCSITVTDSAGNISNSLPLIGVPPPPPTLSDISISDIASTSARVHWSTDVSADSQVFYGTTTAYGLSTTLDASTTMSHVVMLSDLTPSTRYHVMVASSAHGMTATSSDQTFMTASSTEGGGGGGGGGTGTSTPLVLTGTDTVSSTAVAGAGFASGWEWILHFTVPDDETVFNLKFSDFMSGSNSLPAAGNIRFYSSESSTASTSDSAIVIGAANTYPDGTLMLTGDTSSTTPGRQIDVTVQVAVPNATPTGNYSATFWALSTTTMP